MHVNADVQILRYHAVPSLPFHVVGARLLFIGQLSSQIFAIFVVLHIYPTFLALWSSKQISELMVTGMDRVTFNSTGASAKIKSMEGPEVQIVAQLEAAVPGD